MPVNLRGIPKKIINITTKTKLKIIPSLMIIVMIVDIVSSIYYFSLF